MSKKTSKALITIKQENMNKDGIYPTKNGKYALWMHGKLITSNTCLDVVKRVCMNLTEAHPSVNEN